MTTDRGDGPCDDLAEPRCHERGCLHFRGGLQPGSEEPRPGAPRGEGEPNEILVCAAFPGGEGIPDVIAFGEELHLKPFPNDNGIQFQPDPEREGDRDTSGDTE